MEFDHTDILKTLPHRPPFLFIDRVIDIIPGQQGIGIKRLSGDELLVASHKMVLPNILHLEIMAQTTAMICAAMAPADQQHNDLGMGYLAGADIEFGDSKMASAGDTIEARVKIIKYWGQFIIAQGALFIDNDKLSHGRFTLALAESPAT